MPNVDILSRCNTSSVESQLRSKRLRWLGHTFRMPNDRLPKKFCLVKLRVAAPQVALGLVTMMLHQVTVVNAALLGHTRMLRTDCLARQDLSCMHLAHHELESVLIIITIVVVII